MKKITIFNAGFIIIFLAFGLLPFTANSQTHFTPATNNGAGNWHFYPVYANLDGVPLVAGDEIAIFDGNICVGSRVLTSSLDSSYSVTISHDFIAHEKSGGSNGYTGGNSYTWRCYDASASTEYIGSMVYDLTYTPQDYTGSVFPETMTFRWSWIGLSFTAIAPTSGDIAGNITESVTGDDIADVSVTATGTETYTTSTDVNGDYLFDNINVDTYTVSTSHDDFQNASQANVSVTDGNTTTQNFVLTYKTGSYEGIVYDGTGTVVDGATVTINGETDNTDATGAFSIPNLAPGTYSAVATKANYASTTAASQRIGPDSTTTHNFTIYSAGIISGTITDGTNSGTEDGVTVTVSQTGDTYTSGTVNPGEFTFDLSTGTYTLTYSKTGFHEATSTNIVVTAGQTTNADKTIYAENWTFTDGDPFSDVWTIYLNTVTGDGGALKNGDELAIYAPEERGTISAYSPAGVLDGATLFPPYTGTGLAVTDNGSGNASFALNGHTLQVGDLVTIHNSTNGGVYDGTGFTVSVANANDFELSGVNYVSDETVDMFKEGTITVETQAANHNLAVNDKVNITDTDYDGLYSVLSTPTVNRFTITGTYVNGNDDDGQWQDYTTTTVNSTAHGRSIGESVTISGTTNYNGAFTVSNITANTFDIEDNFVADDATGKWVYGEQMVGLYYLTGPISNAGTTHDLKAYSVLNDGSAGYEAGEDFTFKLSYAGGSVLTDLNTTTWETGAGLTDPGTTYPSESIFSMVNLDFDMPPGSLVVDFLDENAADPDVDLNLTLYKNGTSEATETFSGGAAVTFNNLDAGTYTLNAIGERFADTTYTDIVVAPSTPTTKNYVINHFPDETQTISLDAGFQLISRRVDGDSYDMSDYLGGTMAPTPPTLTKLDMTKDEDGNSDTYSGGILTDGGVAWNIKRGYNFKMNASDAMVIAGTPIAYSSDISIREVAYSMISYLPDYTLDAEVAFTDLMTADLDFIRDKDGNSLTKVSGVWVDHIGNCNPGDGFLIKWNGGTGGSSFTFNYPAQSKSATSVDEEAELVHFPFYNGYGNPMKNTYTMYVSGDDLEIGDEVAAFDGTTLVGAIIITSNNPLDNDLKAFEELFDTKGFTSGNKIALKVWKANEDTEYWLNFTNVSEGENMYMGTTYPSVDGMKSVLELALSPDGINDNLAEYINIYPNPSNGFVNITSPENIDRLMIINIVGQTVLDINPETGNTQINLENLNPGVYFVNLVVNEQKITKKLTIQ